MSAGRVFRILLAILLLAVFAAYCYFIFSSSPTTDSFGKPAEPAQTPEVSSSVVAARPGETADVTVIIETVEPDPTPEPVLDPETPAGRAAGLGLPTPPDIDVSSWEYILANETHNIQEYAPPLATLEGQQLDERIIEPMQAMVQDTRDQGLTVFLSSGYRSYSEQKTNYERKVAQYPPEGKDSAGHWIVLPPGTSEHQTGLCCDITYTYVNPKDTSLAQTPMYQYMSQHCQEFGFIVRYPEGREDITGVMYEPWHFRYVGVEAATYIMENSLTLEEFLALYGVE